MPALYKRGYGQGSRIKIALASERDSRVEHATRVLHPEAAARRRDFDA
jgi:hypothetical protein